MTLLDGYGLRLQGSKGGPGSDSLCRDAGRIPEIITWLRRPNDGLRAIEIQALERADAILSDP